MTPAPHPRLSVCIIVKDEADLLARCLDSIAPAADELVVVDTGSSDGSVGVARSRGAKVTTTRWRDDFSHARNVSIDNASGVWILWLDADDVVPEASLVRIKELKREQTDKVYGMVVRNQKSDGTGTEFIQARMFPNRPDIRFEGRIHEQMMPSALRLGMQMVPTDVVVEHHGYADEESIRRKALRNIEMLLGEFSDARPDPVLAIEIADACTIVGDSENAGVWYEKVLDIDRCEETVPTIASQAHMGLGNILNEKRNYESAAQHFVKAAQLCPERTDVLYCLAVSQEFSGKPVEAVDTLQRILGMPVKAVQVGVNFRQTRIKAILRLGRILRELGRTDDLRTLCEAAVEEIPDRPEIRNMVGTALYQQGKMVEALHVFEQSLKIALQGNIDAYVGLCVVYLKAGRGEVAQQTIANIEQAFASHPRFWAAKALVNGSGDRAPVEIDESEVEEEIAKLRRAYGL